MRVRTLIALDRHRARRGEPPRHQRSARIAAAAIPARRRRDTRADAHSGAAEARPRRDRPPGPQQPGAIASASRALFDGRPLLTQLPLELAGVRIDIAGLAADRETTILSIDPGTRSRAHARAIYRRVLAAYRDAGHAYELEWTRPAASRLSGSQDGRP